MQRDVKVGLVLGVLLVAVVAVVFFRRDDEDRDKLAKLMPAPDEVADRARDLLGPSPTDPYPVPPEYLAETWQSPKPTRSVRTPTPQRNRPAESSSHGEDGAAGGVEPNQEHGRSAAILLPPEIGPAKLPPRPRSDASTSSRRPAATVSAVRDAGAAEYTIQPGDTLMRIAHRHLGDVSAWELLYEANRDVLPDPENIPAGQRIRIPAARARTDDRPMANTPVPPPTMASASRVPDQHYETYVVQPGDTLISIAKEHYRSGTRFLDILDANHDKLREPRDLREGMVIRLPQARE